MPSPDGQREGEEQENVENGKKQDRPFTQQPLLMDVLFVLGWWWMLLHLQIAAVVLASLSGLS